MDQNLTLNSDEPGRLLRRWAADINLNNIVNFHNVTRALFKQELEHLSNISEKNNETALNKQLFQSSLEDYDNYLTTNTFLMMYSYTEEWFFIYSDKTTTNGGSLERFENSLILKGLNKQSSDWQQMLKAEKIRNCLLHANGRLTFVKKVDCKCLQQIASHQKYFAIKQDRLIIKKKYIEAFRTIIVGVLDQLS